MVSDPDILHWRNIAKALCNGIQSRMVNDPFQQGGMSLSGILRLVKQKLSDANINTKEHQECPHN